MSRPVCWQCIIRAMRFKNLLAVVALLILAAGLRVWQIDQVPPGLHHDEVINGEIVENDIFAGHPAIFYATGGREGLFHLTLAAALRLIGYNAIGFRFAGFFWGMIGLAAIYALANRLLGRRVAFITLAFAAVSFWSIYEGRAATRSVSLIAVSALAALAFFSAWQPSDRPRLRKWIIAGVLLGLTLYTYIAARVIPIVFCRLPGLSGAHPVAIGARGLARDRRLRGRRHRRCGSVDRLSQSAPRRRSALPDAD